MIVATATTIMIFTVQIMSRQDIVVVIVNETVNIKGRKLRGVVSCKPTNAIYNRILESFFEKLHFIFTTLESSWARRCGRERVSPRKRSLDSFEDLDIFIWRSSRPAVGVAATTAAE